MAEALSIIPPHAPFIELQSVDSTNNYARQQIHADLAQHGMVFFAHEQYAGKGQRGKQWATEKDTSIAMSILIKPQSFTINQLFEINVCAALATHCFFSKYAGDATKIKWPNDLYWQDRKAGGILIETVIKTMQADVAAWQWAIVGIGVNINQTTFNGLPNPVSLKQISGKTQSPLKLAKELYYEFVKCWHCLITNGFNELLTEYNNQLYKKGQTVKLKKGTRIFEGLINEVSLSGKLLVQTAFQEELNFGEVEWMIS